MLDTWIDATSLGRTNLPPDRVPWKAILTLLSQCIYGGKIDNEFDQRLLLSFLEKLFNAKCFEVTIRVFSSLVYALWTKEFFRTCNVLPFSCTHLALRKVMEEGLKLWLTI